MWKPLELAKSGRKPTTKRVYEYRMVDEKTVEIRITTKKDMVCTLVDLDILSRMKEDVTQMYILRNAIGKPYVHLNVKGSGKMPLSRYVMESENDKVVDHTNGDTLDNRKENLRVVSRSDNLRNRKFGPSNKSGFRGVHKGRDGWKAIIHIGTFETKEEAFAAYREAYEKLFPGILIQE